MSFEPDRIVLTEAGEKAPFRWELTAPLTWTGRFHGVDGCLEVPASPEEPFETDLASVPRCLTWLLPRYGKYTKAAVLHDYLCQNFRTVLALAPAPSAQPARPAGPGGGPGAVTIELADRSDADEVFRQAMRELGVPWARRWVMWSAVNWATAAASLWPGRRSRPRLRRAGRFVVALPVVVVGLLVWSGALGTLLGDSPDWRWLRAVALAAGGFATGAACVLAAGYVAQGRWDRWLVQLVALAMTVASLPLLTAAVLVAVPLGFYLFFEDLFSGFSALRAALHRRSSTGPETPRDRRIAEVQAS